MTYLLFAPRPRVVPQQELSESVRSDRHDDRMPSRVLIEGRVRKKLGSQVIGNPARLRLLVSGAGRMEPRSLRLRLVAGGRQRSRSRCARGIDDACSNATWTCSLADDLDVHLRQLLSSGIDVGPERQAGGAASTRG